jgi:SAM-dependent methyltransferase
MNRQAVRQKLYEALWSPSIRPVLIGMPFVRRIYDGWARVHPFDTAHGVETSGSVSAAECAPDAALAAQISPYGGSQPSIVRHGLLTLPDHERYAFVDLGCGKGRPLVVASELPFRRLLGVELSPRIAAVARANAEAVARRYPDRTPIDIAVGDATAVSPPAQDVVYFMYHPFGRSLVRALVDNIVGELDHRLRHAFFVYYNPVHGDVLDQSPQFARWSAEIVPYAPEELGYGPDLRDAVVIWQTLPTRYPARAGADRRIVVDHSGSSAGLEG